jgi:flagellar protein FliJ
MYKFRLEPLRKLRVALRDRARVALAEAYRAEQVLTDSRAELARESAQLRELQRAAATGPYLDVNRLLEAQRYELTLASRSRELEKRTTLVTAEVERRRLALVEANREVRVLELLDDRRRRQFRRRAERIETIQLDEAAARQLYEYR